MMGWRHRHLRGSDFAAFMIPLGGCRPDMSERMCVTNAVAFAQSIRA